MRIGLISLVVILLGSTAVRAEDYVPMTKAAVPVVAPDNARSPADPLVCADPPKLADLGTFRLLNSEMSLSLAGKLGLPIGSLGANGSGRVLVQDWSRSKTCLSTDGRTQLVYGQAIRVVAAADNFDINASLSLGAIAANSTLKGSSSNVQAVVIGLTDIALLREVNKLLGPLNVETYDTVKTLVKSAADLALTTSANGTPDFLGLASATIDMSGTVLTAFAVQQISDGKTCVVSKAAFPNLGVAAQAAIESAYLSLVGSCDNVSPKPVARATALEALNGIKVKK
ncbi:hypothetical protein [Sphingomonas sp. Root710]|uniref:hypothetical protein n=1 Tax=Sphingomonas sp. Root710 TaxID=1736594 RepID=UPI000ACCC415|nr:hypothetical protein [Sphingomonas sp. Root710]